MLEDNQTRTVDATIAICTCNRLRTLPLTLQSLKRLRGGYSFEVLIVNGPSTDGTTEYLNGIDWVRLFDNPEFNLSISRNIAIDNAAGRYIAFIDDDAVPEHDWLELLVSAMDADPTLSAAGGFIRDANGINFQARYVYCDDLANEFQCDNPDYTTFLAKEQSVFPSLTGTNIIFKTEDVRKVGGFDEVFAYFLDETDVNKRMHDAGMRQVMLPKAEIHHKYAPSHLRTEAKVTTNMYPTAKSIAYFCARHGRERVGWSGLAKRLEDLYRKEYHWKIGMLTSGTISPLQFGVLMQQTSRGILDGILASFETSSPSPRLSPNLSPPLAHRILKMRPAQETLRLCMFSQDHVRNELGGIGRWTNLVATGLAGRGHEVTVIGELADTDNQEYCDFTNRGFWSHIVGNFQREVGNEADCLGLPAWLANTSKRKHTELMRIMPRRDFQVVSTPIWDVEGAATLASGVVPTVLSLHTCAGLMLQSKPEWKEDENYYKNHVLKVINAEIQALRRTPMILANSIAIMRDISDVYGLNLTDRPHVIIPHGISDILAPEELIDLRMIRNNNAISNAQSLRVLFLGRLESRKGVKHMVEAMDSILASMPMVSLDIVGSKIDEYNFSFVQLLLNKYPTQVTWHGFLEEEKLDEVMRSVDIFLAPSLYESFGLIYVEAMRYSLPSVAFAAGGVPEVVTHGEDGLLVPVGDTTLLRGALEKLIVDRDLRKTLSHGARRSFEQKFTAELMVERLEKVYWDVAANSNGSNLKGG